MSEGDGREITGRPGRRGAAHGRRRPQITALLTLISLCGLLATCAAAGAAGAPGKPTPTAPARTIAGATPTFTWSKVVGATRYELQVVEGPILRLKKTGITKSSWKSSKALPTRTGLKWRVRAANSRGTGAWSKYLVFSIASGALEVGDPYQGGKVAYILQSGDPGFVAGQVHGLIAATADQGRAIPWWNGVNTVTGARATALGTGLTNTNAIIASQGTPPMGSTYAAFLARNYTGGGHSDWYLPSRDELYWLMVNFDEIGGFDGPGSEDMFYWSSSEADTNLAWWQEYVSGYDGWFAKSHGYNVRAVRSF